MIPRAVGEFNRMPPESEDLLDWGPQQRYRYAT